MDRSKQFSCGMLALLLLLLLGGCGGSGDLNSITPAPDIRVELPAWDAPTTAILRSNVVTVPDDDSVTISNVTETGLTLTGNVPALAPGQVIVSGAVGGLIRKVIAIATQPDGSQQVVTKPAALEDIVHSGALRIHHRVTDEDMAGITLAPGVELASPAGDGRGPTFAHTLTFLKTQVGGAFAVEASGTMQVEIDFVSDFEFDNDGTFQRAIFYATTTSQVNLEVVFKRKFETPTITFPYGTVQFPQIPIPGVPGLVMKPGLTLAFTLQGTCEPGVSFKPEGHMQMMGGVEFRREDNFAPRSFSTKSLTGTLNTQQQNFFAQAKVTMVPVAWQFDFLFGPVIGPAMGPALKASVPGFELEWNEVLNPNDPKSDLTLRAVNKATIGASAGMLSTILSSLAVVPDFEITLYEEQYTLVQKSFRPGDVTVTVQ